jgi:hypothetical protein
VYSVGVPSSLTLAGPWFWAFAVLWALELLLCVVAVVLVVRDCAE